MQRQYKTSFIHYLIEHPVASHIMMICILFLGGYAALNINTQFFPTFNVPIIFAEGYWPGASSEAVEKLVTTPIERILQQGEDVVHLESRSFPGFFRMGAEFSPGVDISELLNKKKNDVDQSKQIPDEVKQLKLYTLTTDDPVAHVVVTGFDNIESMRAFGHDIEYELSSLQEVSKVYVNGLPPNLVQFNIPVEKLAELKVSMMSLEDQLSAQLGHWPLGKLDLPSESLYFRLNNHFTTIDDIMNLLVLSQDNVPMMLKSLVKDYSYQQSLDHVVLFNGKPALDFEIRRSQSDDTILAAKSLHKWVDAAQQNQLDYPEYLDFNITQQHWQLIKDRMSVLVKNAFQGFGLVLISLFLLMRIRLAGWVALGIPISFSVALFVLYFMGISLNMMTLFSFIMMLGLVMDDTIVISEQAYYESQRGLKPFDAVSVAIKKTWLPVLAATLTTLFAFIPLLSLKSLLGQVLIVIPIVAVSVLIGSMIECFLILPHHLKLSFQKKNTDRSGIYQNIERFFHYFQNHHCKVWYQKLLNHQYLAWMFAGFLVILTWLILYSGAIKFTFFPSPPGDVAYLDVAFFENISDSKIQDRMAKIEQSLRMRDDIVNTTTYFNMHSPAISGDVVRYKVSVPKASYIVLGLDEGSIAQKGAEKIISEIYDSMIQLPDEINRITISPANVGPPGKDIYITIFDDDYELLYQKLNEISSYLNQQEGVFNIATKISKIDENIFKPKEKYRLKGLTQANLAYQMQKAIRGTTFDQFDPPIHLQAQNVDLESFLSYPIFLGSEAYPLREVADQSIESSFSQLPRIDGKRGLTLTASIDHEKVNAAALKREIFSYIEDNLLKNTSIQLSLVNQDRYEREAIPDLIKGFWLALTLIYLTVAWVLRSYLIPLIVLTSIPFAGIGAILGHAILGIDMTFLSLFSLFGLSGIVVNTAIILITEINAQYEHSGQWHEAIIQGCCRRIRAVFLTLVTTVFGLVPLLFDTTYAVQFLKPMVVSIIFGLLISALMVMVVVPCFLTYIAPKERI